MLFNRNKIYSSKKIQIDVYVNYGDDNVRHKKLLAEPGISALDALGAAADIEYTPDESATGHHGSVVTAIDGFKININHFWIYYIFEENQSGWRVPMCTPDSFEILKDVRIAWRYHFGTGGKDIQSYGPLSTSRCIGKIKRCNRQF